MKVHSSPPWPLRGKSVDAEPASVELIACDEPARQMTTGNVRARWSPGTPSMATFSAGAAAGRRPVEVGVKSDAHNRTC